MTLLLSPEQEALGRTARDFVRARLPPSRLRALRGGTGHDPEAWRALADLGICGILVPEAHGGAGLGFAELGVVMEELGRTLAPTPMLSTAVLGASALALGGSEAQRRAHLSSICKGECLVALAHQEGARHAPYRVATRLERAGPGFVLSGQKRFVLDGPLAEVLVVVARLAGADEARDGLALVLVPARSPGVLVSPRRTIDGRAACDVSFSAVPLEETALLGSPGAGAELLDRLLERGAIALCAEMLGSATEVFEHTLEYLRTRKQFGVPIGSFQALRHRAARLYGELELSRSIVLEALRALDAERPDVPALASAAKARLSDAFLCTAAEGIQMHGGIGVTEEHDLGLYYKRARVAELTFGDAAFHRDRFARLSGF